MSDTRDSILSSVKRGEPTETVALPEAVPVEAVEDLVAQFARELAKLGGELIEATEPRQAAAALMERAGGAEAEGELWFISDRELPLELGQYLPVTVATMFQMADCRGSVVEGDFAIADTATVGLQLDTQQPRTSYLLPEISVVIVPRERMLRTLMDALVALEERGMLPTAYVFVTGPSRTADIEKTLVIPAHGPKRLIVVLYG